MMEEGETGLELLISQDRRESADGIVSQWELIAEGKKLIEQGDRSFLDAQIDSQEMSIIIFTSGTTGMAKALCCPTETLPQTLWYHRRWLTSCQAIFSSRYLRYIIPSECTCNFIMPLYKGGTIAHCEGLKYIVKNIQEVHPYIPAGGSCNI